MNRDYVLLEDIYVKNMLENETDYIKELFDGAELVCSDEGDYIIQKELDEGLLHVVYNRDLLTLKFSSDDKYKKELDQWQNNCITNLKKSGFIVFEEKHLKISSIAREIVNLNKEEIAMLLSLISSNLK